MGSHVGSGVFEESSRPSLAEQEIALEKNMCAEVLAKQQHTLSGKANTKEWDYGACAHRSRRMELVIGNTKIIDGLGQSHHGTRRRGGEEGNAGGVGTVARFVFT